MKEFKDLKLLAAAYSIEFKDLGKGHIQLSNHGVLVNYWPLSKNRTCHIPGKEPVKHCSNWDAIQLCMKSGVKDLAPKKKTITKNRPAFSLNPVHTNPAGIKNLYSGEVPPWEFPTMIMCYSDMLRIEAYQLVCSAELMEM